MSKPESKSFAPFFLDGIEILKVTDGITESSLNIYKTLSDANSSIPIILKTNTDYKIHIPELGNNASFGGLGNYATISDISNISNISFSLNISNNISNISDVSFNISYNISHDLSFNISYDERYNISQDLSYDISTAEYLYGLTEEELKEALGYISDHNIFFDRNYILTGDTLVYSAVQSLYSQNNWHELNITNGNIEFKTQPGRNIIRLSVSDMDGNEAHIYLTYQQEPLLIDYDEFYDHLITKSFLLEGLDNIHEQERKNDDEPTVHISDNSETNTISVQLETKINSTQITNDHKTNIETLIVNHILQWSVNTVSFYIPFVGNMEFNISIENNNYNSEHFIFTHSGSEIRHIILITLEGAQFKQKEFHFGTLDILSSIDIFNINDLFASNRIEENNDDTLLLKDDLFLDFYNNSFNPFSLEGSSVFEKEEARNIRSYTLHQMVKKLFSKISNYNNFIYEPKHLPLPIKVQGLCNKVFSLNKAEHFTTTYRVDLKYDLRNPPANGFEFLDLKTSEGFHGTLEKPNDRITIIAKSGFQFKMKKLGFTNASTRTSYLVLFGSTGEENPTGVPTRLTERNWWLHPGWNIEEWGPGRFPSGAPNAGAMMPPFSSSGSPSGYSNVYPIDHPDVVAAGFTPTPSPGFVKLVNNDDGSDRIIEFEGIVFGLGSVSGVFPEEKPSERCLRRPTTIINVVTDNGNKYLFNGDKVYNSNVKYLLYDGKYIFKNIPEQHPMAILNNKKRHLISYTGDSRKKSTKRLVCTNANGNYDFYYGDITVTVTGDFGYVSIYCYNHGYMGGEDLLLYSNNCNLDPDPQPEPEPFISCCPKPGLIDKRIFINADGTKSIKPKKTRKSILLKR